MIGIFTKIVVCCAALVTPSAFAQEEFDQLDTSYSTGLLLEPKAEIDAAPKTPTYRNFLPPLVDLSNRFPKVGNQGDQGSCVGWAVGYAARSYYNSKPKGGRSLRQSQIPSPAYIYNMIQTPHPKCDGGSYIGNAFDLLKRGSASLAEYPYNYRRCPTPPTSVQSEATSFKIEDWERVSTSNVDQVKAEIAAGNPVVIGVQTTRSFSRIRGRQIWRATENEKIQGGHAITLVAYNERGQYFKFINSWGAGWGDRGYGRMSYETYVARAHSAYVMRLAEPPIPPVPPAPPPNPNVPEIALPSIGCGKLQVAGSKGAPKISGYVGTEGDLNKIREIAERAKAKLEVTLRPWPQCETLMTIDGPLNQTEKPSVLLDKNTYKEKDTLSFDVRMANFQGYLHIAYVQKDGNVVNLVESDPLTLTTLPKNHQMTFGDGKEGRARFTVSEPFGDEIIVAIASKSPLFSDNRPKVETEREFLTALRKAIIARPDPTSPARFVSASFVTLKTRQGE